MGCNCGKNKSSASRSKNLQEAFAKEQDKKQVDVDSVPQVQSSTFRDGDKKIIKIKQPSLGSKVKNFAKAVGSRVTQKKIDDSILQLRQLSCHGNNEIAPCPYRGDSAVRDGYHYCTACGCGDRPATWLNNPEDPESFTKLHYPWVSCPVRNPGFGDYKSYGIESDKEKTEKKEGMDRKKIIEAYLNASGIEIPDHPAPQPKTGE